MVVPFKNDRDFEDFLWTANAVFVVDRDENPPVNGYRSLEEIDASKKYTIFYGSGSNAAARYFDEPPIEKNFLMQMLGICERGKDITFVDKFGIEMVVPFTNDRDFHYFLSTANAVFVVDRDENPPVTGYRSLANMDASKKYTFFHGLRSSSSNADARYYDEPIEKDAIMRVFEAKANIAAVKNLIQMGHTGVKMLHASKKVRSVNSGALLCEIGGVVETDTHFFVVEAKFNANLSCAFARVAMSMDILRDPKYQLVDDPEDPRLQNVVGILATSTASNADLTSMARSRGNPMWLLVAEGSELRIINPLA